MVETLRASKSSCTHRVAVKVRERLVEDVLVPQLGEDVPRSPHHPTVRLHALQISGVICKGVG